MQCNGINKYVRDYKCVYLYIVYYLFIDVPANDFLANEEGQPFQSHHLDRGATNYTQYGRSQLLARSYAQG